jgi:hypothetical protein
VRTPNPAPQICFCVKKKVTRTLFIYLGLFLKPKFSLKVGEYFEHPNLCLRAYRYCPHDTGCFIDSADVNQTHALWIGPTWREDRPTLPPVCALTEVLTAMALEVDTVSYNYTSLKTGNIQKHFCGALCKSQRLSRHIVYSNGDYQHFGRNILTSIFRQLHWVIVRKLSMNTV